MQAGNQTTPGMEVTSDPAEPSPLVTAELDQLKLVAQTWVNVINPKLCDFQCLLN